MNSFLLGAIAVFMIMTYAIVRTVYEIVKTIKEMVDEEKEDN
jgi:hypothetical protein